MSDRTVGELIDLIKKTRPEVRSYSVKADEKAREEYDSAKAEIASRLRDAEWARADADGYRERMLAQAVRIAELEADIARLTRAAEIVPTPQPEPIRTETTTPETKGSK